jgi:hypothetical protein
MRHLHIQPGGEELNLIAFGGGMMLSDKMND